MRDLSDTRLYDTFNGASFTLSCVDLFFAIYFLSPVNWLTLPLFSWLMFPWQLVKTAYETVGPCFGFLILKILETGPICEKLQ